MRAQSSRRALLTHMRPMFHPHYMSRCRAALALLVLLFGAAAAAPVPADSQATLVLRILAFDRKLPERAKGTVKIAVVYREGDDSGEEIAAALDTLARK